MTSLDGIIFSPLVPWWLIAALAAAGAAILGLTLWRGAKGVVWRGLAIVAVLAALTNPALIAEEREARPDIAVVVTDRSQSQTIGNRRTVTDEALATLSQQLAALDDLEVRYVEAGQVTERTGGGDGTLLFGALTRALSDVPPDQVAGAIFITDGQVHDTPDTTQQMALRAPLHVLLTGTRDAADRRLVVDNAPTYGIVGDQMRVTLQVIDTGTLPQDDSPRLARVTLRLGRRHRAGAPRPCRRATDNPVHPRPWRGHGRRTGGRGRPGRADFAEQPHRYQCLRCARTPARSSRVGAAARRRAHLAQSAEG